MKHWLKKLAESDPEKELEVLRGLGHITEAKGEKGFRLDSSEYDSDFALALDDGPSPISEYLSVTTDDPDEKTKYAFIHSVLAKARDRGYRFAGYMIIGSANSDTMWYGSRKGSIWDELCKVSSDGTYVKYT